MKEEVLIAGFGGQGILTMGQLMANAAMYDGLYATWFPSYGPEMRGGTANCTTVFSDEEIGSPIAAIYDTVIVMNQPSLERFGPKVRKGGLLIIDESMVPIRCHRTDVTAIYVPASPLARDAGIERAANVVLLGAFLGIKGKPSVQSVENVIRDLVGAKRPHLIEPNLKALQVGIRIAQERTSAVQA